MMKKFIAMLLAFVLCFGLVACGNSESATEEAQVVEETAEPVTVIVFAAASMTETLTEIGDLYMAEHPEVTLQFNFDSSGTLKTQIEEGADVDVFISAGQKQMNQLDISADASINTDGLDFVLADTRFNILENKVALCVASNSECGITSYDELAEALKAGSITFAMGNSDVPVGQYTQKILAYYEIDESSIANIVTYGSNVKEVTTAISEGTVDCGVVYQTDAFSAGLAVADTATKDMCGQVIYPAAVMNVSKNVEAASAFLEFCKSAEASAIFEEVGFTALCK